MKSRIDEDIGHKETEGILEKKEDSERKGCVYRFKGVVAGFGAVMFYVSSGTCVQLLNRRIPDFELNTIRSAVSLLAYSSYLLITGKWPVVPRDMIAVTLMYILASFLNSLGYYTAVSLLPAACEVSLQNTITVLAGLVLFSVFWKEKITLWKLVYAALCIVGVVMVVQPKFMSLCSTDNTKVLTEELNDVNATTELFNHVNYTMDHVTDSTPKGILGKLYGSTSFSPFNGSTRGNNNCTQPDSLLRTTVGFIVVIITGVMLSVCVLITIRNPCITENILQVLFWTFMMSTVISAVVMFALETPVLPSNVFDTVMVTMHSFLCAGVWPLCIIAPKYISGNTFTLIISTDVVFMLISQYTVLSSILPGHRNWIEGVGVVLVLIGCSMSTIMEMVKDRAWNN